MKRNCFICTTPYQILAATAIVFADEKESDIVVVSQFNNADKYAERIRNTHLFNRVFLVNNGDVEKYKKRKSKLGIWFGILENYLKIGRIVPELLENRQYSHIYISSQALLGRLISLYYMQNGAEIIFFDDGEGSYDDDKIYEAQGIDRIIRTLLFGKKSVKLGNKRMLYCPELYRMTYGNYEHLSKILNWSSNKAYLEKMNYVCGYSMEAEIHSKYIFIDTIASESFDEHGVEKYNALFGICVHCLKDKMIVKKHPRDNHSQQEVYKIYRYPSIPFEIICANSDIKNMVLISAGSSAVLMPKILFDVEPTVILLNHITGNRLGDNLKRNKMISFVRDLYEDKKKFIIPETEEEFEIIIEKLKNKGR